jgi:hypothetical protein
MGGVRRLIAQSHQHRLVPWLWFLVAYLAVVLLLLWLGGHVSPPATPDLGWSD